MGGPVYSRSPGRLRRLVAAAMLVAGLGIIASALYIPAKAALAQVLMQRAWSTQLETGEATRPWGWADFTPLAKLTLSDDDTVFALSDASGESLAFGPTIMAASSRPGDPGTTVIAAHRDTHFRNLGQLQPGDEIVLQTIDDTLTYRVTGTEIVHWNNSGISPHMVGPSRLALVTCWPLDGQFRGPERYIVWADQVVLTD